MVDVSKQGNADSSRWGHSLCCSLVMCRCASLSRLAVSVPLASLRVVSRLWSFVLTSTGPSFQAFVKRVSSAAHWASPVIQGSPIVLWSEGQVLWEVCLVRSDSLSVALVYIDAVRSSQWSYIAVCVANHGELLANKGLG